MSEVPLAPAGTDYRQKARNPLWKVIARSVLLVPFVNRVVVTVLGALPEQQWYPRLPVVGSATLLLDDGGSVVLQRAERCQVAKEVHWGKGHLQGAADRLALDLALLLSQDADLFLDVGAYTGMFALAVARRNPRVVCHAYEIVPENYLLLWENTVGNNLVTRVEPRLVGLAAARGTLKVPSSVSGGALASSVALDSVAADGVDIPIAPLDEIYRDFGGRMVMKIDVEGFEWEVFKGAIELVRRVKPDIVCEVLRRAPSVPEMHRFLCENGYGVFHITSEGLRPATRIVPVVHERDWLFTTRSTEELRSLGFTVLPERS